MTWTLELLDRLPRYLISQCAHKQHDHDDFWIWHIAPLSGGFVLTYHRASGEFGIEYRVEHPLGTDYAAVDAAAFVALLNDLGVPLPTTQHFTRSRPHAVTGRAA